ncbi:MAG: hypothetical protein U9N84_07080 [Actinomycetota bacterium]|nr:hypothetical protein [Actinomycetota bacterium]
MNSGSYYGTEVDGKWWKRYRGKGFFTRGGGDYWMDETGFHFRKMLTATPFTIGWDEMVSVRIGKSHAGRWGFGRPLLTIEFSSDARPLCAGFYLTSEWSQMEQIAGDISTKLSHLSDPPP